MSEGISASVQRLKPSGGRRGAEERVFGNGQYIDGIDSCRLGILIFSGEKGGKGPWAGEKYRKSHCVG